MSALSDDYLVGDALLQVAASLPRQVIEFSSVASLIGALLVLGIMAGNSELVVIQAAGWSKVRVIAPALLASIVISGLSVLNAEYLVPRAGQIKAAVVDDTANGVWFRDGQYFAHVGQMLQDGEMRNLTLFAVQDQLQEIKAAKTATFNTDSKTWILSNVKTTAFKGSYLESTNKARDYWRSEATPDELLFIARPVDSLSLSQLVRFIEYRSSQGLESQRYRLSLWKSLLQPSANLIMVLLASSLVFGSMRMVSMGYQITLGLMYGLGFYYLQDLCGFLSLVYNFHPIITLLCPQIVFLGLAIWRFT